MYVGRWVLVIISSLHKNVNDTEDTQRVLILHLKKHENNFKLANVY